MTIVSFIEPTRPDVIQTIATRCRLPDEPVCGPPYATRAVDSRASVPRSLRFVVARKRTDGIFT